jgi:hypothetical protein
MLSQDDLVAGRWLDTLCHRDLSSAPWARSQKSMSIKSGKGLSRALGQASTVPFRAGGTDRQSPDPWSGPSKSRGLVRHKEISSRAKPTRAIVARSESPFRWKLKREERSRPLYVSTVTNVIGARDGPQA